MLNTLKKFIKNTKRAGRGYGSGRGGHTSGRGTKGHHSRSGFQQPRPGFEGGQMPLSRRLPKLRGFERAYFKKKVDGNTVNIGALNQFAAGTTVTPETLIESGLVQPKVKAFSIKILGNGKLTKKLNLENLNLSKSAQAQVEKLGGSVKLT